MKVKVKYTLICIQEDDTRNWDDPRPQTAEELRKRIEEYCQEDMGYILDSGNIKLEKVEIIK